MTTDCAADTVIETRQHTCVKGPYSQALITHLLHAQAMSEDEFESMKRELHGSGASTLRFAESAEQQHMDVDMDHSPNRLAGPALNDALATRLAPAQGPSSFTEPAPVRPHTQVSFPGLPGSCTLFCGAEYH